MRSLNLFYILLFWCLSLSGQSQHVLSERAYIHLDKDCYVAGEDVWVKFSVVDAHFHPSLFSKVGYVEVCDTEKVRMQLKLALDKGIGSGKMKIPLDTPSGIYQLVGYTRYMRNEGEKVFFKRQIAIVNMATSSEEDRIELVEPTEKYPQRVDKEISGIKISTDKSTYTNRSMVNVSLENLPGKIQDMVVSVTRNDSVAYVCGVDHTEWRKVVTHTTPIPTPWRWVPEYEGHIITGRVCMIDREKKVPSDAEYTTNIGFIGPDIRYVQGQNRDGQLSCFYTGDIYGTQEIVTSVVSRTDEVLCLDIVSPFAESLPDTLPMLKISAEDAKLMDRFVNVQLQQLMGVDSLGNNVPLSEYYYYRNPIVYDLNEYTRFSTVGETITEFIRRIVVRKGKLDRRVLKVLIIDENRFSTGNTLVLLDGIALHDHEEILKYNPHNIRTIKIYDGKYSFGDELYECIVSFTTHRQNLPAIQLNETSQLIAYDCPFWPEGLEARKYSTKEERESLAPDFRHTLYWNPFLESQIEGNSLTISFYTSDLSGEYKIVVEGFTEDGKPVYGDRFFNVSE